MLCVAPGRGPFILQPAGAGTTTPLARSVRAAGERLTRRRRGALTGETLVPVDISRGGVVARGGPLAVARDREVCDIEQRVARMTSGETGE